MNKEIFNILSPLVVDGVEIPIEWLKYKGNLKKYVVFSGLGETPAYHCDDSCAYSTIQFDFDIYSDGNYNNILKSVKQKLQ